MVDVDHYRHSWLAREQRDAETHERARVDTLSAAKSLAETLALEYGATKVVLFGSTLRPGSFSAKSDIDLAAAGLGDRFFAAYGRLLAEVSRQVDLIALETAPPALTARITRGLVLHES